MIKPIIPTDAINVITEPFTRDEAIRHGWLGDSRMGKSTANRILLDYILAKKYSPLVLTIDDKTPKMTSYPNSAQYATVGEYLTDPNRAAHKHVVFRGVSMRRNKDDEISPAEIAELAWDVVREASIQVVVCIDELADATPGQGQAWLSESEPVSAIFRKGGGAGISVVWTTQLPQSLPLEAFGLSETLGIFRLDGREVDYLYRKRVIGIELMDVIPALEVGEWILYKKGRGGWDGNVYQFPMKRKGVKHETTET
jgi:hypothetical protein